MKDITLKTIIEIGLGVFIANFSRYLIIAGIAFAIFYIFFKNFFQDKRIQKGNFPRTRILKLEFIYSISTFVIFSVIGIIIYLLKINGYTKIYNDINEFGILYLVFSVIVSLVIHDTYFYWTHRLLHWKYLFPIFHKVHHLSFNPSPWASFSFHPLEAVIEGGILPLLVLILPLHPIAIISFLLIMTVMNVIGHLGYELYPSWFLKSWLGKMNNTSTHHNMHHRLGKNNYGLYFNWWDRWMKTNHKDYENHYSEVTTFRKEKYQNNSDKVKS